VSDASVSPRLGASFNLIDFLGRYGTLIALLLLIIFNLIFTRNFATLQTLNVNLTQVCTIVIVATGMTLVIATGGIDLSVGSMMAMRRGAGAAHLPQPGVRRQRGACRCGRHACRDRRRNALRPVQRLAGREHTYSADCRHAGAVHRRARHRAGHDQLEPPGLQRPQFQWIGLGRPHSAFPRRSSSWRRW
jgi:hypothetical protein